MPTPLLMVATATEWLGIARMPRNLTHAGFEVSLLVPPGSVAEMSGFVRRFEHVPVAATTAGWVDAFATAVQATAPRLVLPCDDTALRLLMLLALSPPLLHVPYANGGQALNDVVSGIVPVYFSFIGAVESFLRSGQLKALAVATGKRASNWPDVPTVAELGYKDFAVTSWNCVLAPAGTPPEIIARLHDELARIVQQPDVRSQFLTMGSEPMSNTPEQFGTELKAAVARWSDVARLAGIRAD